MSANRYKTIALLNISLGLILVPWALAQNQLHPLTEVYRNDDFQITGISVSKTGRIFINFPRWSDHYLNAVVEIEKDGTTKPFPDEFWNRWDMKTETAGKQFVCVQSVVVDNNDHLWVVDATVLCWGRWLRVVLNSWRSIFRATRLSE